MVKRVEDEAGVSVITGATVTDFDGTPGDFTAKLSNGDAVEAEALGTGQLRRDIAFARGAPLVADACADPLQALDPAEAPEVAGADQCREAFRTTPLGALLAEREVATLTDRLVRALREKIT